jgi:Uma2 family endonuclease
MMERVMERTKIKTLMTAEELLRLPDDGLRYELVRGELIVMTPASPRHGRIAMQLGRLLANHVAEHQLGEVYAAESGFKLAQDPDTVRAPDLSFIVRERIPPQEEQDGFWALAPDLVAEIISPNDTAQDVQTKVVEWLAAGVRLVWVVYPDERMVTEYRSLTQVRVLTAGDSLDGGDVVPGFTCPLSDLFD